MALALAGSSFRCRHYIDAFTAGRSFVSAASVDRVASVAIQYAYKVRTTSAHVTEQEQT
jgi:arginine/ornithine N-succinyltransferase beta subunit